MFEMENGNEPGGNSNDLLTALLARAENLLQGLRAYQTCLQEHGKQKDVEIRAFRRGVESEVKSLRTIATRSVKTQSTYNHAMSDIGSDEHEPKYVHALKSSNLSFYEAVWYYAKRSTKICALGKQMSSIPVKTSLLPIEPCQTSRPMKASKDKHSVVVDIIADDGLQWIKVSTITEKRLLFEMAKQGWEAYGDYSDSDEADSHDFFDQRSASDVPKLELVRLAEQMRSISHTHRAKYRHPSVTFVLPKVREGVLPDIDAFLADLRDTGVYVSCADTTRELVEQAIQPLSHLTLDGNDFDYARLLPSPQSSVLTSILNIDCTILLSLISDISHVTRPALPTYAPNQSGSYHTAIVKQIESEEKIALLPTELYPVVSNKHLLCTSYAARRMLDIVGTMGTDTEKLRADIVFAMGKHEGSNADTLRAALKKVSTHPVPSDLQLPIETIIFDADALGESQSGQATPEPVSDVLPASKVTSKAASAPNFPASDVEIQIATQVISHIQPPLSPINKSVFLYGWLHSIATVTSNRVVANQLSKAINEVLDMNEREAEDNKSENKNTNVSTRASESDGQNNTASLPAQRRKDEEQRRKQEEGEGQARDIFVGPRLYICDTARSLVGKEKQGRFVT